MSTVSNPICAKCGSQRVFQKSRYRCRVCLTRLQSERRDRLDAATREAERVRDNTNRVERQQREDPMLKVARYAKVQEWREANREAYLAGSRRWYAENLNQARAKKLAEYYANPEPFIARNFLRKARMLEAVCSHGESCVTPAFLKSLYGSSCRYCSEPAVEADHFFPLSRGGLNCRDNLVPACFKCNRSKHATDPYEFIAGLNLQ